MEKEISRISRELRAIQWTLWFLVAFGVYEYYLSHYLSGIGSDARAIDVQSALAYVLVIVGILCAGLAAISRRLLFFLADMNRTLQPAREETAEVR
jgi:hypothetical protein